MRTATAKRQAAHSRCRWLRSMPTSTVRTTSIVLHEVAGVQRRQLVGLFDGEDHPNQPSLPAGVHPTLEVLDHCPDGGDSPPRALTVSDEPEGVTHVVVETGA